MECHRGEVHSGLRLRECGDHRLARHPHRARNGRRHGHRRRCRSVFWHLPDDGVLRRHRPFCFEPDAEPDGGAHHRPVDHRHPDARRSSDRHSGAPLEDRRADPGPESADALRVYRTRRARPPRPALLRRTHHDLPFRDLSDDPRKDGQSPVSEVPQPAVRRGGARTHQPDGRVVRQLHRREARSHRAEALHPRFRDEGYRGEPRRHRDDQALHVSRPARADIAGHAGRNRLRGRPRRGLQWTHQGAEDTGRHERGGGGRGRTELREAGGVQHGDPRESCRSSSATWGWG